jgi:hypothetical protein
MATYDPQRNRGRRPVHDDEPAAVDELLGITDEPSSSLPASPNTPELPATEPEPATSGPEPVHPVSSEPAIAAPGPSRQPSTPASSSAVRRGAALPAVVVALVALVVAWLVWRLRRR